MIDCRTYFDDKQVVLCLGGRKAKFIRKGKLANRLCKNERFELFGIEFVLQHLEDNSVFLDVGAGIGYYSIILKLLKSGIVVWGFEPCKTTYDNCLENLKLNELFIDITMHRLALSNYQGKGILKLHKQDGLNTLGKSFVESKLLGQEEVDVVTLDMFLRRNDIKKVDIIKADIEGGELRLFQGATELLSREDAPVILFENVSYRTSAFGHIPQYVEGFLQSFGYRIKQISEEMFTAQKEKEVI